MFPKACHKENRARTLLGGPSKCPGKLATKRTRDPCQDLAGRTFKMSRNACHKEDRARNLLGEPTKCPGKLATKGTVPGTCYEDDLQNAPENVPQRESCQDLARRTFKMSRKAFHKKNRARTLLGGPSKCSRKLATKKTAPGPC